MTSFVFENTRIAQSDARAREELVTRLAALERDLMAALSRPFPEIPCQRRHRLARRGLASGFLTPRAGH